jgi:PPOX class probable FMN-dependent enzyme
MRISSEAELRGYYQLPKERTILKEMNQLDRHAKRFISLSPFAVLSTASDEGSLDASPRGGVPGFVQVLNVTTLIIPDSKGNNRLDSLSNIVQTGAAGLLFLIPGMDETLRVNGNAYISAAPDLLSGFIPEKQPIATCIVLEVKQVFLHCAKALMRSGLWNTASQIDRGIMPSMGEMLKDQIGHNGEAETREQMLKRYENDV